MDNRTKKRLEADGWKVGGTQEFLGLTEEEAAIIELKVGLANAVRERRSRRAMTQEQLGHLLEATARLAQCYKKQA